MLNLPGSPYPSELTPKYTLVFGQKKIPQMDLTLWKEKSTPASPAKNAKAMLVCSFYTVSSSHA